MAFAVPLREWLRHHTVSVISTAVDFAVMALCVEVAHRTPVTSTIVGAACGAVASFLLARYWTFRSTTAPASRQVGRYLFVSAMSLVLNAAGEHLFHGIIGLQYMLARLITAIIVSNGWNYPMQRFFVFSDRSMR